jgi:hypothetical protein
VHRLKFPKDTCLRKLLGVVIFVGILGILVLASTRPSSFRVQRSLTINALRQTNAPLINDFHRWDAWSSWAKIDPAMRTRIAANIPFAHLTPAPPLALPAALRCMLAA